MTAADKLWTNSGDSHFIEPPDLYEKRLPADLADRLPRSERISDEEEIVHIDGEQIRRSIPKPSEETARMMAEFRAKQNSEEQSAGAAATGSVRLKHLDEQGVWGEVVYPSLGLWYAQIRSIDLVAAAARALNDYVAEELVAASPRLVPTATLPLQSVEASATEIARVAKLGFHAIFFPTGPPAGMPFWNDPSWMPLWDSCAEHDQVVAFHIGTNGSPGARRFRGAGGALLNYVDTSCEGQLAAVGMVASGALERHPDLKVLISEGGGSWAPFIGDRMNEFFRQQPMWNDGRLSLLPKEYVMRQVYASFQHDETAVPTLTAMGYRNIMFGTDYPHIEGTYPNTQKVLHGLLEGVDEATSDRIRCGAFLDLFPHVGRPVPTAA
ncbi:MAG: amidohydrolase family protein [Acidimicrobiia bacterium]